MVLVVARLVSPVPVVLLMANAVALQVGVVHHLIVDLDGKFIHPLFLLTIHANPTSSQRGFGRCN